MPRMQEYDYVQLAVEKVKNMEKQKQIEIQGHIGFVGDFIRYKRKLHKIEKADRKRKLLWLSKDNYVVGELTKKGKMKVYA